MRICRRWSEEDRNYLIEKYPYTNTDLLAQHFGVTRNAIHEHARLLKVKKYKPYSTNHHFFKTWSPDMAYILGFTIADGNMHPQDNGVQYKVGIKDKCVIEYIVQNLCVGRKASEASYKRNNKLVTVARTTICSPTIFNDLNSFGVIPRKTGKEVLPECPVQLKPDLLRGIFDGDGCIHLKKGTNLLFFSIVSASEKFITDTKEQLGFNYGYIRKYVANSGNPYFVWTVTKQAHIKDLHDFMYYGGYPFCLERKRTIFSRRLV